MDEKKPEPDGKSESSDPPPLEAVALGSKLKIKLQKRPKDILSYLGTLATDVLDRLYSDTFTCLTVFRSLPELAKQYVLRLLLIESGVPRQIVDGWVRQDRESQALHRAALARLSELKVFSQRVGPSARPGEAVAQIFVNRSFQQSLRRALRNEVPDLGESKLRVHRLTPTDAQLDAFAKWKWDQILHYMVAASKNDPGVTVQELLTHMGLMKWQQSEEPDSDGLDVHKITSKGFAFPSTVPHRSSFAKDENEIISNGGSCIAAPNGSWLRAPVVDSEAMVVAELHHALVRQARQNLDISGHYSRPDVLTLRVNRTRQSNVQFVEEGEREADSNERDKRVTAAVRSKL